MHFDLFINFDGNCREAVDFYAKTFRSEVEGLMLYNAAPPDPSYQMADADKNRVMYCSVPIAGLDVMFCDIPSGMELITGNNISPTLSIEDKAELDCLFHALSEGGSVEMDLQKTFWSELYGMVTDKYGIIWQLTHWKPEA